MTAMTSMTAEQKLKYTILNLAYVWQDKVIPTTLTGEEVDDLWDEEEGDDLLDAKQEIRNGGINIDKDISPPYSRHYESCSQAIRCPTGEWVGFTYWYGGGKHGNPEEIDWIEYAFDLEMKSEVKTITVQTFKLKR